MKLGFGALPHAPPRSNKKVLYPFVSLSEPGLLGVTTPVPAGQKELANGLIAVITGVQ